MTWYGTFTHRFWRDIGLHGHHEKQSKQKRQKKMAYAMLGMIFRKMQLKATTIVSLIGIMTQGALISHYFTRQP